MKAQDIHEISRLCERRTELRKYLTEIDAPPPPPPPMKPKKEELENKPVLKKEWKVGWIRCMDGYPWQGSSFNVLCTVPDAFVRMLVVNELAQVERELLALGVQL